MDIKTAILLRKLLVGMKDYVEETESNRYVKGSMPKIYDEIIAMLKVI